METVEQCRMGIGNVDPDLGSSLIKSHSCRVTGAADANVEMGLVQDDHTGRVVLRETTSAYGEMVDVVALLVLGARVEVGGDDRCCEPLHAAVRALKMATYTIRGIGLRRRRSSCGSTSA
jgi:hypothetical protein